MSVFTSLDNNISQLKYDPEDLSKLLHSLSLVHNKYSEISGVWLVINRDKFDLFMEEEPHHTIILLTNITTGQFMLRVMGRTKKKGFLSSWDEFQLLCINSFRLTVTCAGFADLNENITQDLEMVNFPFKRVASVNCEDFYKTGNAISESELEGKGLCTKCKLSSFKENIENLPAVHDEFEEDENDDVMDRSDHESEGGKELNYSKKRKRRVIDKCGLCQEKVCGYKNLSHHMLAAHPGYEPFSCVHCGKTFSLSNDLYSHNKLAHGHLEKQYKCSICDYTCCQTQSLRIHVRHHELNVIFDEPVKCPQCSLIFRNKSRYERHIKKRHAKEHSCKECGKLFFSAKELTQHKVIHTGERPFQCNDCGECFGFKSTLKNHEKIHMRAKGMSEEEANTKLHYFCEVCGKDFSSLGSMQKHVKHVHERYYENVQCDLCGAIFKTAQLCKQHNEKVHSSTPRHQCNLCGMKFGRDEHLKRHMVTHEASANFSCIHCGRRFKRKDGLDIHIRTHTGEKPFKCSLCSWAGIDPSSYSRHKKTVHGIATMPRNKKTVPLKLEQSLAILT